MACNAAPQQTQRVFVCMWWHFGMPAGLHDLESLWTAWNVHMWELALQAQPWCSLSSGVVRKPPVILVTSQLPGGVRVRLHAREHFGGDPQHTRDCGVMCVTMGPLAPRTTTNTYSPGGQTNKTQRLKLAEPRQYHKCES
jgi:hypothetical protein